MDHKDLIDALGGPHKLQVLLSERGVVIEQVTARSWTLAGKTIPAKYWLHVKAIADTLGVPVSFEQLATSVAVNAEPQPA